MGSMVVGVVVSAFLLTPFFVCREHSATGTVKVVARTTGPQVTLPGPLQDPSIHRDQGSKQFHSKGPRTGRPIPPLCSAAGTVAGES